MKEKLFLVQLCITSISTGSKSSLRGLPMLASSKRSFVSTDYAFFPVSYAKLYLSCKILQACLT